VSVRLLQEVLSMQFLIQEVEKVMMMLLIYNWIIN
jgi:hypothetical protein